MPIGLDMIVPFDGDFDPTLPYASNIDRRETPGSLLLVEPSHSYSPWPAGAPAPGQQLPNVLWENAARLTGGGDAGTTRSTFLNDFSAGEGVFERTARGGLHGVVSRSAQGGHRAQIETAGIIDYMNAHPTHAYAMFMWVDVTRAAEVANNMYDGAVGDNTGIASRNFFVPQLLNVVGPQRLALSAPAGRTGGAQAQPFVAPAAWGNIPPYDFLNPNDGRSYVFYSYHLVDVSVSGVSFSELDAIDAAAHAEAFGPDGRFADDSWTAPATLIAN